MNVSAGLAAKVERNGDATTVTFTAGRLRDVENVIARELEGLEVTAEGHTILDFVHVTRLNSVELGTLIGLHTRARAVGGRVTLLNLNAHLRELFSVTRLDTLLAIVPEVTGPAVGRRGDGSPPSGSRSVLPSFATGDGFMRTSQFGDRVRVRYVQTFADGSVRSSRAGVPLLVTVGTAHRRLPGLGDGLVGLAEGQSVALDVPAERAFGPADPARVKRVARARFAAGDALSPGARTRMRLGGGRSRTVRVVGMAGHLVVVDLNHPHSGLSVRLEVELVAILEPAAEAEHSGA